ncbi:hypothetical protein JCM8097_008340 [Rhodosporidiobolus ruineniae]
MLIPEELQLPRFDTKRWHISLRLTDQNPEAVGIYLVPHPDYREYVDRKTWIRRGQHVVLIEVQVQGSSCFAVLSAFTKAEIKSTWGWVDFIKRDKLYYGADQVKRDNAFILRCTLTQPGKVTAPPPAKLVSTLPPPATSAKFRSTYGGFFESKTLTDVDFVFPGDPNRRSTSASREVLAGRSEYFRTMFASGWSETATTSTTPGGVPPSFPSSSAVPASPWADDDDGLDWLPTDWLSRYGPREKTDGSGKSPLAIVGGSGRSQIVVTDTGYVTYRAMLYWLYTEKITFTPLASSFIVDLLREDGASVEKASTSPISGDAPREDPFASRRNYLLRQLETQPWDGVAPASPHAVYALADKLGDEDLKLRAKEAIVNAYTVDNIMYELISTFTSRYDELQTATLSFARSNWDKVTATPAFERVFDHADSVEGGEEMRRKLVVGFPATAKSD